MPLLVGDLLGSPVREPSQGIRQLPTPADVASAGPTLDSPLPGDEIQSLVDQRVKVLHLRPEAGAEGTAGTPLPTRLHTGP